MEGMGRRNVLGVESPDPTLSLLGAMGLAASAKTGLVVDLAGGLRTSRTVADLAEDGPSLEELGPGKPGVALIAGGPVGRDQALGVIEVLAAAWPSVIIRCRAEEWPWPVVPLRGLLPGSLFDYEDHPAVWQPWGLRARPPGPGPILPRLGAGMTRQILAGRLPARSRWIDAWVKVWSLPWA
jgi:hypothetical protein